MTAESGGAFPRHPDFGLLADNVPGLFAYLDREGRHRFANRRYEELFDMRPDEIVGRSLAEVLGEDPAIQIRPYVEAVLSGESVRFEHRVETPRLGPRWMLAAYSPDVDDTGDVVGFFALVTDISERRRAEEALARSHRLLREAERIAQLGAWEWEVGSGRIQVSEEWQRIHGVEASELSIDELLPMAHPEDRPAVRRALEEAIAGTAPYEIVHRFIRQEDGAVRVGYARGELVSYSDGRTIFHGIGRDITEERAAEEALRRSERKYRSLVDHAPYGICQTTVDGGFISVNPALVEMLGYDSAEELLALDLERELYPDADMRGELMAAYRDVERIEGVETRWLRKDGGIVTVRLAGRPIHDDDGELQGFELIAEDVSKRRRLEGQLRQAQKMEAIGQLTGGIAHDFNNELSVILLTERKLSDQVARGEPLELDDLKEIAAAAERAADMTEQLLGFSRRAELDVVSTDLTAVVAGHCRMLRHLLPESIAVRFDEAGAPIAVAADPNAVEQMLLNLATNARDAMPEGGTLDFDLGRCEVGEEDDRLVAHLSPGRYVRLSVTDSGTGMDQETRARLFEPFYTTKRQGEGSGLGMAMVYGLIKQQGGHVDVHSEVGRGTVVKLYFRATDAPVEALPETRPHGEARGSETILVVEDEEPLRRVMGRTLERHGYRVLTAVDGEGALRTCRRRGDEIELVVSDLVMPGMSGADLYRALRAGGNDVSFVLASGYTGSEADAAGELRSVVPFVHKPWTLAELLSTVRDALDDGA